MTTTHTHPPSIASQFQSFILRHFVIQDFQSGRERNKLAKLHRAVLPGHQGLPAQGGHEQDQSMPPRALDEDQNLQHWTGHHLHVPHQEALLQIHIIQEVLLFLISHGFELRQPTSQPASIQDATVNLMRSKESTHTRTTPTNQLLIVQLTQHHHTKIPI